MSDIRFLARLSKVSPNTLLGLILRAPLALIPRGSKVRVLSGINRGMRWRVGYGTHGCWIGSYESQQQEALASHAFQGMVAWDVGANVGFYSLALSQLVGPNGHVHAFEPVDHLAASLTEHLALNETKNVAVHCLALTNVNGRHLFQSSESDSQGHLTNEPTNLFVQAMSADHFLRLHPGSGPSLIKIDIEGEEGNFLDGATKLIENYQPVLVLSLHGHQQAQLCDSKLRHMKYFLYTLSGKIIKAGDTLPEELVALPSIPNC